MKEQNYVEDLESYGLSKSEIAFHTGLTTPTVYKHLRNPEALKKIERLGYIGLIQMAKKGELA